MKVSRRTVLAGALALPASARATGGVWNGPLLMATGRPGGAYDIYGPAWGRLAEQKSGVDIIYRASGGAVSDILLIEQDAAQLGMTTVAVADQARTGSGGWTAGVKFGAFRALFPMFPSILQIVAPAPAGILTLAGLAGKTIGIGPDGGSAAVSVPGIMQCLGVAPARCVTGDFTLQVRAMMTGALDACAFLTAPPAPPIYGAAMQTRLRLIGFTPDQVALIERALPGLTGMPIPANMFPGQMVPIASVGTPNFAIGSRALPDTLVMDVTLAALQNEASLASVIPAAAMSPGPMLAQLGQMTFHPGAAAALRSVGLQVPPALVEG